MPERFGDYHHETENLKTTITHTPIDFVERTKQQGNVDLTPYQEAYENNEKIAEWRRGMNMISHDVEYKNTTPQARKFLDKYPHLFAPDSMDAIEIALARGLKENELKLVLEGKYQNLKNLPLVRQNKILDVVSELKNKWMLDFVDINRLEDFLSTSAFSENDIEKTAETPALRRVVQNAIAELGVTERGGANKYFREQGMRNSAAGTPWCAAFINWVLMKSGLPGSGSNKAKSFVGILEGMGHAGIKVGERLVNGNWWNKVAYSGIPRFIVWYAIPTENGLVMKRGNFSSSQIPDGAIVVMNRNTRTRQGRMAT